MKKFIYIIIAVSALAALLAACVEPAQSTSPTSQPQSESSSSGNEQAESPVITIICPYFYTGEYDSASTDESTAYLEQLFADNGFTVVFNNVYFNLESQTCYEEYFSYLSGSLSNDNTIALVPGYKSEHLSEYVSLMDLSKEIEDAAPSYYTYVQNNALIANSNDKLIVSAISAFDSVSVVLIANSVYSEYSKSVDTSEEFLSFVNWARNENEFLTASVILTFHDDITSRSNILYDIYLPRLGYIPLGSYLNRTYSLCVDAKKPGNIYDTTKLSFFESLLEGIEVDANYSKIVVKQENTANKNFNEYSSVVMPLGDISYYSGIADYNFYPANYTMEILNPDMFLERVHENSYFAAAQGTNQAASLELIDWIYSDIQNYTKVKYGDGSYNYAYDTNGHIALSDAGIAYTAESPLSSMINSLEYEAVLQSMPSNYLSEINSISYVKGDSFYAQYENYQYLITVNNYIYDASNRFTRRWETSVRALELTTERKVDYVVGSFAYDNIDDLIAEISK